MAAENRQVLLVQRPIGIAQATDFAIVAQPLAPLPDGHFRVRNRFLSVEPAMRGWTADASNYAGLVPLGSVMRALAAGEVVESRADGFPVGTRVTGWFGWQDYCDATPEQVTRRVTATDLPLSLYLGVLGINGLTAWIGLHRYGEPRPGETVLVSTAAGAVGSLVGQLARRQGCRTVGIAGGAAKVDRCLADYGYDAAVDYRDADFAAQLAAACPDGVDIYFDNVAGRVSDAAYPLLAMRARVVVCGTASIASWDPWPTGPRIERHLLVKRARMQGFVIFDHAQEYDAVLAKLETLVRSGELAYREDVLDGIECCPDALAGIYRGENDGKRLIAL